MTRKLDRHIFNEAYLMHTSTSPQYAIIASCDVVGGDDGAARRHGAGRGIDHRGARLPPRDAQGRRGVGQGLVVQGVGARAPRARTASATREDWMLRANEKWHGFGNLAPGFNMLDPIKATVITPGLDVSGKFAKTGIPASIVTQVTWPSTASSSRRPGCTRSSSCSRSASPRAAGTRWSTALQQFKDDYDKNQPLWRILPEFCAKQPSLRARRACATCASRSTTCTRRTTSRA